MMSYDARFITNPGGGRMTFLIVSCNIVFLCVQKHLLMYRGRYFVLINARFLYFSTVFFIIWVHLSKEKQIFFISCHMKVIIKFHLTNNCLSFCTTFIQIIVTIVIKSIASVIWMYFLPSQKLCIRNKNQFAWIYTLLYAKRHIT